jgi:hypothetical protein
MPLTDPFVNATVQALSEAPQSNVDEMTVADVGGFNNFLRSTIVNCRNYPTDEILQLAAAIVFQAKTRQPVTSPIASKLVAIASQLDRLAEQDVE